MHFKADAVTGAMRQAGQVVVGAEAVLAMYAFVPRSSTDSQGAPIFAASNAAACARFSASQTRRTSVAGLPNT